MSDSTSMMAAAALPFGLPPQWNQEDKPMMIPTVHILEVSEDEWVLTHPPGCPPGPPPCPLSEAVERAAPFGTNGRWEVELRDDGTLSRLGERLDEGSATG